MKTRGKIRLLAVILGVGMFSVYSAHAAELKPVQKPPLGPSQPLSPVQKAPVGPSQLLSPATKPFTPVNITTDKLTVAGMPPVQKPPAGAPAFTPVNITTDKLTVAGKP